MPTERVNFGIYSGPLQDATWRGGTSAFIGTGTTPARDITQDGQPLEMEFVVRLDLEADFPASTISVVLEGSDVGGPKPTFEPVEGASFTFDATGGVQRAARQRRRASQARSREVGGRPLERDGHRGGGDHRRIGAGPSQPFDMRVTATPAYR